MTFKPGRPYRLQWAGGYFRGPVWPPEREPDIDVVRNLAKKHLQELAKGPLNDTSLEVTFFAEGAYNKLFQISAPELESSYLLRATLPVEPYFKTESEVATIAFLRANTAIPVPKIIAWQSNLDGDLGSEWILMEKLDGVALYGVWRKVPWDRKLTLVEEVAKLVKELHSHSFDKIGSLYFKSALEELADGRDHLLTAIPNQDRRGSGDDHDVIATGMSKEVGLEKHQERTEPAKENVTAQAQGFSSVYDRDAAALPPVSSESHRADAQDNNASKEETGPGFEKQHSGEVRPGTLAEGNSGSFAIDRVFDSRFFTADKYYHPGNRGPYRCTMEWLSTVIRFQQQWIKDGPIEDDDDYDSDFEEEAPKMLRYCKEFLDVLPRVFANEEAEVPYTLHHHDLNASNIIVNPETFDIIGIVDWEMVNIVPMWRAAEHPEFLDFAKPWTEEISEPPTLESLPPDSYRENQVDIILDRRDRWDYQLLRDHWDATMKKLRKDDEVLLDPSEVKTKNGYFYQISNLTDMWNWARIWLYRFETGTEGWPPEDDSDESPKKKRKSKEDLSEDLASSQKVLAKEEAENEVAENNDLAVPSLVDAHVNGTTKDEILSATTHSEYPDTASTGVPTREEPESGPFSEAGRIEEYPGEDEQGQAILDRNTIPATPAHFGDQGSEASPSGLTHIVGKDDASVGEHGSSGSKQQEVDQIVSTEDKGNPMEAEGPTSSNISEAGTEYQSSAESIAIEEEGSPISSNASAAGLDYPPLVKEREGNLWSYCPMS